MMSQIRSYTDISETVKDVRWKSTSLPSITDQQLKMFQVVNPQKTNDYISYTVKGIDLKGEFEILRRYSDFLVFRRVLVMKWPGIFIPCIPPKKAFGNSNDKFLEDRRIQLQRFIQELAKTDFLVFSNEFEIFTRTTGNLEKHFSNIIKEKPQEIFEKYKKLLAIYDNNWDNSIMVKASEVLLDFKKFVLKSIPIMEQKRTVFFNMMKNRESHDINYSIITFNCIETFINNLLKYEDNNLDYYNDHDPQKRLVTHSESEQVKNKIKSTSEGWINPFQEMLYWIKAEIQDLYALKEAMEGREMVMQQKQQTEQKMKSKQAEVDILSQGKKSFKQMMKSLIGWQKDIQGLMQDIEECEIQITELQKLIDYITMYLFEICIPKFKKEKEKAYQKQLQLFSANEVINSNLSTEFWQKLLEMTSRPFD